MKKLNKTSCMLAAVVCALGLWSLSLATSSPAEARVKLQVQTVMSASSDEAKLLKDFASDVSRLTSGEVRIEVLAPGTVVGVRETLDAVDKGLLDGGFAWTHYWSGKHPAAMLFGSPTAGAGVGLDNIAFLSWYLYGGGQRLYDELWREMGMNVKGFMLQPAGPEALGWFKEPIRSMSDFRKLRFRTPPGIPGQAYKDIGIASVAMGGGDILPALQNGSIDASEWCCPKPDKIFGFQKVLKHYYLQGAHQAVVNTDIFINKDVYNRLSSQQKAALEVAANASLMKGLANRIYEQGSALNELMTRHGVKIHDTPTAYFKQYMDATRSLLERNAQNNRFFSKVWKSQTAFARTVVPYWASTQTGNAKLGRAFAFNGKDAGFTSTTGTASAQTSITPASGKYMLVTATGACEIPVDR